MNKSLPLLCSLALLAGCAQNIGANDYATANVNQVNVTKMCKVISVRQVKVQNDDSTGATLGVIAGGVAGSQIGNGSTAGVLGALGGALVGGVAGELAEKGLTTQTGYEYVVQLDQGGFVTVTQGNDVLMAPGQRCLVIYGNQARVIPYNGGY